MAQIEGVTLESVFMSLCRILYGSRESEDEDTQLIAKARKYIIPMTHTYLNPITPESDDTFVEYVIESDDRIVQDTQAYNAVAVPVKKATVLIRFIGRNAEGWAKMFHMQQTRQDVASIWFTYCYAKQLLYVSSIGCHTIDYYGSNGALAWDVRVMLSYTEVMRLNQQPLESVSIAPGKVGI